jgi:hypothetical protein
MISSFPSSRDEDKIKPLRSILCLYRQLCNCHFSTDFSFVVSTIKEVKPVDWERPRIIGIVYESSQGTIEGNVEFDTIEAARDWRNEIRGVWIPFPP